MKKVDQTEFDKTVLNQFMPDKNLFGKDGAFAPMPKNVIEKSLEVEKVVYLNKRVHSEENKRNGPGRKTIKSSFGTFDIETPQGRQSNFKPKLIKKHQTILADSLSDKMISL